MVRGMARLSMKGGSLGLSDWDIDVMGPPLPVWLWLSCHPSWTAFFNE